MSKIKFLENSNEKYTKKFPCEETPVFNSKLFLDINFNFESISNSSSISSEDTDEIEDINSSNFLSKELINELNFSNVDNSFKDDKSINFPNDSKSFVYLNNDCFSFPIHYINNINSNEFINNNYNPVNYNNYNNFYSDYCKSNYYKKKYKIIKDKKKDWVCQICMNLNYGFRTECNRCKLPKERCIFYN